MQWWHRVTKKTIRADALAGLSGAIIVIPQGAAYATIAGLPPQYGLYAAMVPAIIAALFGSSWHLVSGPTAAISIVVFSTVSPLATPGSVDYVTLTLTLTFLVGVFQLAMGLARMGALVNFISHSVVIGFTAGAAFLIAAGQLKNFFGVEIVRGASFFESLHQFALRLTHINWYVTAVGVATVVAGIVVKRYSPRMPFMIVGMLVGSAIAVLLNAIFGSATTQIATVGAVPAGLPPLSAPDFSLHTIRKMTPGALAIAMLGLAEAVSIARAISLRSHQHIDGTQEFMGQGLSNIFGGFFSSYASSGSFTRSGVNYDAGAKTPLATVFAALFLIVALLLIAPLAAYLPIAAMAGILFMVAYALIDLKHINAILRTDRGETAVLVTTFLATLFVELEFAIYIGVLLSLMLVLRRSAQPMIRDAMPAPEEGAYHFVPREFADSPEAAERPCPQLKIMFVNGEIYFGSSNYVREAVQETLASAPEQKHALILAPGVSHIDFAGMEMLAQEARRRRAEGGGLYFHRLKPEVIDNLRSSGALADIDAQNIFSMGQPVMDAIYSRLDTEVCRECTARVFRQCRTHLPNREQRT